MRSFPGSLSHFQLMIVYDRIWVLGGSTNAIFTCEQNIAFNYLDSAPMAYGAVTRTLFQATNNLTNPFTALCFPYWVTSY